MSELGFVLVFFKEFAFEVHTTDNFRYLISMTELFMVLDT